MKFRSGAQHGRHAQMVNTNIYEGFHTERIRIKGQTKEICPLNCIIEYLVLALGEETTVQAQSSGRFAGSKSQGVCR